MRKATVFEAKNSRAVSILKAWCRAVGISYRVSAVAGVDLSVVAADGSAVLVQVQAADSETAPSSAVVLPASVITGRKIRDSFALFEGFQTTLGYEPKTPVDRGALPESKLSYHDHFEDVAFRHSELHRCPNPDPEHLARYETTAKKATHNFLNLNKRLCEDNMLDFDDLFAVYASMWTVVYIGYYEVPAEQDIADNNERKLYTYLWQRFGELRELLYKKGRSTLVTLDTASIGQHGRPTSWNSSLNRNTADALEGSGGGHTTAKVDHWYAREDAEEDEQDEDYISRHCELDLRTPNTRRASATRLLENSLTALGHDQMIVTLQAAIENDRIHPDARKEATRRLADHQQGCSACVHLSVPALEEDE